MLGGYSVPGNTLRSIGILSHLIHTMLNEMSAFSPQFADGDGETRRGKGRATNLMAI